MSILLLAALIGVACYFAGRITTNDIWCQASETGEPVRTLNGWFKVERIK